MVAGLIRRIAGVLLSLTVASVCIAEESSLIAERTFELALQKFELADGNLEKKIDECEDKKIIVPPSVFKSVDLTEMEFKIALFVLHNRAEDACDEDLRGKFLIALGIYKTTAKHYGKAAKLALPYSEDLLFGHYWRRLESEARYLEIKKDQREMLESIPQLQQPFHLFETLSKLLDDR